jgi:GAF domain-containing protein
MIVDSDSNVGTARVLPNLAIARLVDLKMPESDSRFDLELAEWFSRRGGAWSGTASELLVSLRTSVDKGSLSSLTSVGLYAYLQSHSQGLQALGMDVLLQNSVPRMVSLRSLQDEPKRTTPSTSSDLGRKHDPAIDPSSNIAVSNGSPDAAIADPCRSESFSRDVVVKLDSSKKFSAGKPGEDDGPKDGFFSNTGEALFSIVEMRRQIREQGLDLEATVDLVIGRAREITKCYGIEVGFLPQEIGTRAPTGAAASRNELTFDANLFQSRLTAGEAVQIADAQKHPVLGATYRRAGVGSLIMVPIFRNREVAGAIEFFFREKRIFSPGDVMDLGLIAGVISEGLGGSKNVGVKLASGHPREPKPSPAHSLEAAQRMSKEEELTPGQTAQDVVASTIDSKRPIEESSDLASTIPATPAKKFPAAPGRLWLNFKKAIWTRQPWRL